jgi:hypothetical protein
MVASMNDSGNAPLSVSPIRSLGRGCTPSRPFRGLRSMGWSAVKSELFVGRARDQCRPESGDTRHSASWLRTHRELWTPALRQPSEIQIKGLERVCNLCLRSACRIAGDVERMARMGVPQVSRCWELGVVHKRTHRRYLTTFASTSRLANFAGDSSRYHRRSSRSGGSRVSEGGAGVARSRRAPLCRGRAKPMTPGRVRNSDQALPLSTSIRHLRAKLRLPDAP